MSAAKDVLSDHAKHRHPALSDCTVTNCAHRRLKSAICDRVRYKSEFVKPSAPPGSRDADDKHGDARSMV
jgi:hypothetical protein